MSPSIRIENVSKLYRLGEVGTGTLSHDLHRAWARLRGKPNPFTKVGQLNDRTIAAASSSPPSPPSQSSDASAPPSPLNLEPKTSFLSRLSPLVARNSAAAADYVWALKDINLEIQQGEIVGIIGRNGAGKSTLLKLLSRITEPTTGRIRTKGRIASLLEVGTGFHPELSGRENIYLNGSILGMRRHEISKYLDEIVEFSGCEKYIDTPVKRYSSGMTVRLGFAVAAHLNCKVLIVDEVLAVGDLEFQQKCIGKMQEAASTSGKTILFVSHSLASIRKLCSRSVLLANGQLILDDTTEVAIQSYSSIAMEQAKKADLKTAKRDGSQKVTICGVSTSDFSGLEKKHLASGDSFALILHLSQAKNVSIENAVASVALRDETDSIVWLVRSSFDGTQLCITNKTKIHCEIEDFALAPGTYRGDIFLSERDNEVIDHVKNAFSITVIPGRFFSTGSVGLPTHCKTLTRAKWKAS